MSQRTSTTTGGVGFTGLLAIVFIVLKLVGIITWSWLWVLAPIWIPVVFALLLIVVVVGLTLVAKR